MELWISITKLWMKIIKFSLIPGLSLAKIRRRSRIKHRQHHTNLHEPHKSSLSVLHRDQLRLNNNFVQTAAFPLVAGTSPQGRTLSFRLISFGHFTSHIHTIHFFLQLHTVCAFQLQWIHFWNSASLHSVLPHSTTQSVLSRPQKWCKSRWALQVIA